MMIKSKIQTIQVVEVKTQFMTPIEHLEPQTVGEFDAHIAEIAHRYDLEFELSHPEPGFSIYRVSSGNADLFQRGVIRIERAIFGRGRGKTKLII